MSDTAASAEAVPSKHPKGLGILFFAEMWERFSFYGMKGLLVLYLTNELFSHVERSGERDRIAYGIYGAYTALVYATPFVGGLLADRVLGYRRAVLLGGVLMALGHAVMAVENETALYIALAFLIAGNGFFKPNISSMVGGLYKENDPRRDAGFTIFYMGINLGAGLQFIPGMLGVDVSWSLGFGLAGVGMLTGLGWFYAGRKVLGSVGDPPDPARLKKPLIGPLTLEYLIYAAAFLSVAAFALLVSEWWLMDYVIVPVVLVGFLIVIGYAIASEKVERERLFAAVILIVFNIVFWAFFEQAGSSMNVYTERNIDRTIFGWQIAAPVFQSVNAVFIVILGIPFSMMWLWLEKKKLDPSIPSKFALGLVQLGLGFLVMVWLSEVFVFDGWRPGEGDDSHLVFRAAFVPMNVLILGYLLHTTGELCLSPIGLSMITKLSPKRITAMVMGLWFLSTSVSQHFAAVIATFTIPDAERPGWLEWGLGLLRSAGIVGEDFLARPEAEPAPGDLARDAGLLTDTSGMPQQLLESYDQLAAYLTTWTPIGYTAIVAGILLFALVPLIKKWQHGVT
jgi:POT family proton-dependent oligopeptide transporter